MTAQENTVPASENDDVIEGTLLEAPSTMDKETLQEAERIVTDSLPKIEDAVKNMRKHFWQSTIIRTGVVLVALKIVTITGNIIAEQLRENKKNKNDEK